MNDLQRVAETLAVTFERIHQEQMQDIPLLNPMLRVETLGFQAYQGRILGVVITPWLMNLVMLPGEEDDWGEMTLGQKFSQSFPSRSYSFLVNEIEGIGRCQTYSLYSPMNEFVDQDHALAAAQSFLSTLMVERELTEEELVDEELLGRIMRGEVTPEISAEEMAELDELTTGAGPVRGCAVAKAKVDKNISRRDLLRGNFLGDA
jgi:[NiFe] hydrogenase assembly HybE family chaperone